MASLGRLSAVKRLIKPTVLLSSRSFSRSRVLLAEWNEDWKADPIPKTEEEKVQAAKKYGLNIEDYKHYPDDGTGWGDYPKLSEYSMESKDPFENWDFPEQKRNFGEPMHLHEDMLTDDRYDVNRKYRYTTQQMYLYLTLIVASGVAMYILTHLNYPCYLPLMPKQYPFHAEMLEGKEPVKHYTFEPAESE